MQIMCGILHGSAGTETAVLWQISSSLQLRHAAHIRAGCSQAAVQIGTSLCALHRHARIQAQQSRCSLGS